MHNNNLLVALTLLMVASVLCGLVTAVLVIIRPVGGCLFAIASDGSCNTVVTHTATNEGIPLWLIGLVAVGFAVALFWPKGKP